MSSHSKIDVILVLANLSNSLELYLDWAATPGDDECPPEIVDRLCQAQATARELLEVLGYGEDYH